MTTILIHSITFVHNTSWHWFYTEWFFTFVDLIIFFHWRFAYENLFFKYHDILNVMWYPELDPGSKNKRRRWAEGDWNGIKHGLELVYQYYFFFSCDKCTMVMQDVNIKGTGWEGYDDSLYYLWNFSINTNLLKYKNFILKIIVPQLCINISMSL